jgi:hypothetical protein
MKIITDYQQFEKQLIRKEKVDVKRNFKIVNALYREALKFGIIPLKNPLDGLETDIKIAKVINSVSKTSHKNSPKIK